MAQRKGMRQLKDTATCSTPNFHLINQEVDKNFITAIRVAHERQHERPVIVAIGIALKIARAKSDATVVTGSCFLWHEPAHHGQLIEKTVASTSKFVVGTHT